MSKRRGQENQDHRRGGEKRSRRRKHLYTVVDDWDKGFSMYKIDADSFDSYSDGDEDLTGAEAAAVHLPEPPAVRLESPGPHMRMFFAALGSKIFIVTDRDHGQTPALVFDTDTAGLAIGPHVPAQLQCGFDIVVAVDGTLYAFSSPSYNKQYSFHVMSWAPRGLDQLDDNARYPNEEGRSWKSLPAPPPPFDRYETITSYAVHPNGHTIFMTTSYRDRPSLHKSTYSFNTKHHTWRWYAWVLPFRGQGHFDSELDAWVGLHRDGYICSCRVASDSGSATPINLGLIQLDWQMGKDRLFRKDGERYVTASLAYMGRSKFCLVESVRCERVDKKYRLGEHGGYMLHMTVFGLKYNHKGELRTTNHQSTRSYVISKQRDASFIPVAVWM